MLKAAQLEDLVRRDELGLDMELTENGANLSSGERQLICICRAILRRSRVVILDEATANIDAETDEKIQKVMRKFFAGNSSSFLGSKTTCLKAFFFGQ